MDWPADKVKRTKLDKLIPYAQNSRTHTPEQVEQIARSLERFGWTNPVLVDEEGLLIAGHGRVLAAKRLEWDAIPVMTARGWTEEMKRAYRIADNKLALNADWDDKALRAELLALEAADFQLDLIGFSTAELKTLMAEPEAEEGKSEDEPPAPEKVAISRAGDVWMLGRHRLMCGDSANGADVERLIPTGDSAQLIHADPPYGMGKEADGVQNDNLYGAKLDAFQLKWWRAYRPRLDANASAYIWGNAPDLWRLWYRGGLGDLEPVTMRNEIVWDKGSIAGMRSADLTQFPEASERCLFFQLGRHVFLINRTKDDYWEGWEPLRLRLVEERDRSGFSAPDVKRICGNHMYGHWFGKSQWAFISRENWDKLAAAAKVKGVHAFADSYDELLELYRQKSAIFNGEIRDPREREYLTARPYFDNTHDVMRDVWNFPRVTGEERADHATPKPVAMAERCLLSSLREGQTVLEPFIGSGSTLIAAEKTRRICYGMELDPLYVDVTVRRWQSLTGKPAVLESTGETFEKVTDARAETEAELSTGT